MINIQIDTWMYFVIIFLLIFNAISNLALAYLSKKATELDIEIYKAKGAKEALESLSRRINEYE